MKSFPLDNRDWCNNSKAALFYHNKGRFYVSLLGIVCRVVALLGFSAFMQKILDTISGEQVSSIPYLGVYAGGCVCFLLLGAVIEYRFWTAFRCKALTQYRHHTYNKILNKNIRAFQSEDPGSYISALSNDLNQIKDNYLELLPFIVELVLSFAGTIVLMVSYDITLALVAVGASSIPVLVSSFRIKEVEACEETLSDANGGFVSAISEALQGFRTIKTMKAEKQLSQRLFKANEAASYAFGHREHIEISVAYTASLAGHISKIGFFFVGMIMARKSSHISVGIIVAFVQLMENIIQLAITMPELMAKVKSAKKLMAKNDLSLQAHQSVGKHIPMTCKKGITVEEVSVSYGETEVLHDFSFVFPAGSCCAVIGESGSGKSTLLHLLAGMNRDYRGKIRYDHTDLSQVSNDSIFDLVSVIHQEVFIFDASIRENITMFMPFEESAIQAAVSMAGLEEMVQEKGLDSPCGINGNLLSGGEKQRIGIARSLLQNNTVLLLDEATSALDVQTGQQIMDTILRMKEQTRIVVTHDIYPESMEQFDYVLFLQDGKLAEVGPYRELMAKKGSCYGFIHK